MNAIKQDKLVCLQRGVNIRAVVVSFNLPKSFNMIYYYLFTNKVDFSHNCNST